MDECVREMTLQEKAESIINLINHKDINAEYLYNWQIDFIKELCKKQLTNGWIPVSERLPQLPEGKSFMPLNATVLAPSGLRNTVQMTWELERGWCYLGEIFDWNVIAWQSLPEPWKESVEE